MQRGHHAERMDNPPRAINLANARTDLGIGERSLGLSDVGTDLSDAVHVALDRG
jgi:hypothetical protein